MIERKGLWKCNHSFRAFVLPFLCRGRQGLTASIHNCDSLCPQMHRVILQTSWYSCNECFERISTKREKDCSAMQPETLLKSKNHTVVRLFRGWKAELSQVVSIDLHSQCDGFFTTTYKVTRSCNVQSVMILGDAWVSKEFWQRCEMCGEKSLPWFLHVSIGIKGYWTQPVQPVQPRPTATCSKCRSSQYCSQDCQRRSWATASRSSIGFWSEPHGFFHVLGMTNIFQRGRLNR